MSKEYAKASAVLKALIQGNDPDTGEPFPSDSILNRSEVLRALLTASAAIDNGMAREARRAALPGNLGKPGSEEEEAALTSAFKDKEPFVAIAKRHNRTVRSIETRLDRLGLLSLAQARGLPASKKGVKGQ